MNKTMKVVSIVFAATIIAAILLVAKNGTGFVLWSEKDSSIEALARKAGPPRPKFVRGIHLTAWIAGSSKFRPVINELLDETELNTVVIDIKEYEGEVYIPGVKMVTENKTFTPAIPNIKDYLANLKKRNIYTVARIVVFKDNLMPRKRPELAVKDAEGEIWKDRSGRVWLDPYNKEVWNYNISIAEQAIDLGFDEIQFDYIRFPSDGNIRNCRYSQAHSTTASSGALVGFLKEANERLKSKGANISIDVFGLTTTVTHDMGIGQQMVQMTQWVDYVSPMVYPSHYNKGEYGIADPNTSPYKVVFIAMEGARKRLGLDTAKLRPYLQDFSMGHRYGKEEVRAQIQACYDNDIGDWLLWNPRCVYTRSALKGNDEENFYVKSKNINELLGRKNHQDVKTSSAPVEPAPAAQ